MEIRAPIPFYLSPASHELIVIPLSQKDIPEDIQYPELDCF